MTLTTHLSCACSQSFALVLTCSAVTTSAHNAVITVGSTPLAVFPFRACLQALDAAVNGASPALGGSLVHLAVLALVFGALARIGLRRA